MSEVATATTRIPTVTVVVLSLFLAVANGFISALAVVLAVPGSGEIGPGFKTIGVTFLLGNISTVGFALFSAFRDRKPAQVIGLVVQALTLPACFATALLEMQLLGISDL